ncbi:MAG: hypothetical protein H7641_07720 [Candidatus Heimdallarchaeota archaeon]|nr:hypothetical protein [Candidatus Heimdallarchaeota archaeon]MCK4877451.1 hypothetical protein [Candidatus Heimdallarchaeota archaeon]
MVRKLPWVFPGIRRPNFSLHQISIRIPTRIPRSVLYIVIYGIIFYIFSGGAYDIVNQENLVSIGQRGNAPLFLAPSLHAQYLIEGIVAGFVFAFAALSLYLFDHATRYAFDVSTAQKVELIATVLIVIWYVAILLLYNAKLPAGA